MTDHRLFPHGDFEELAPNLWQLTGSLPFPLPRNMTVLRLPSGELVLHSVVALDEAGMKKLEALGKPRWMIVPHPGHTMDAPFYAKRYPDLKVIAPDDAKKNLPDVRIDFDVASGMKELGLRHHVAPGMRYTEVVLDLDVDGKRALVFTDLVGQSKPKGLFMRLLGPPKGSGVARIVRFRQIADRAKVREFLQEMAKTPNLGLILTGHTPPIRTDPVAMLENAASQL